VTPVAMKSNLKNNPIALALNDNNKKGVHSLQNASSTAKEVKNIGNKRMATRTPDQV
jgi:hypothetical protein